MKTGSHFNCESVEQNGRFLRMRVEYEEKVKEEKRTVVFEVELPIDFVLYMVSAEAQKKLGF